MKKNLTGRFFALLMCALLGVSMCSGAFAQETAVYAPILDNYAKVLCGDAEPDEMMENGLNILCLYAGEEEGPATANDVGYCLLDLDGNGVKELVIGSCNANSWVSLVMFEVYTVENGQPVLVCESWERCLRTLSSEGYIVSDGSSGAAETTVERSRIGADGKTLEFVDSVVYDEEMNAQNPWFHVVMGQQGTPEYIPVTEAEAKAMLDTFGTVSTELLYTPFADYAG